MAKRNNMWLRLHDARTFRFAFPFGPASLNFHTTHVNPASQLHAISRPSACRSPPPSTRKRIAASASDSYPDRPRLPRHPRPRPTRLIQCEGDWLPTWGPKANISAALIEECHSKFRTASTVQQLVWRRLRATSSALILCSSDSFTALIKFVIAVGSISRDTVISAIQKAQDVRKDKPGTVGVSNA
ncbi:hypothetical protein BKA81DRAFT_383297 [Phyllosticta paracitricarpa]